MTTPQPPLLGEIAYNHYRQAIGSTALPVWNELGAPVRNAWYQAALGVVEHFWREKNAKIGIENENSHK